VSSVLRVSMSSKGTGGFEAQESSRRKKLLSAVLNAKAHRPKRSEEELERMREIGSTYNRMMSKRHNEDNAALVWKICLREEAIKALPVELRGPAMAPDTNLTPIQRRWATDTPPIPNFNPEEWAAKLGQR
jgi:hypothetical protein